MDPSDDYVKLAIRYLDTEERRVIETPAIETCASVEMSPAEYIRVLEYELFQSKAKRREAFLRGLGVGLSMAALCVAVAVAAWVFWVAR